MRKQCAKCPWRIDVDPLDIPDGYTVEKHKALTSTCGVGLESLRCLKIMACHESKFGAEIPCVGWMANQLGEGNNLGLRLAVIDGKIDAKFELAGDQHGSLEETLPESSIRD